MINIQEDIRFKHFFLSKTDKVHLINLMKNPDEDSLKWFKNYLLKVSSLYDSLALKYRLKSDIGLSPENGDFYNYNNILNCYSDVKDCLEYYKIVDTPNFMVLNDIYDVNVNNIHKFLFEADCINNFIINLSLLNKIKLG